MPADGGEWEESLALCREAQCPTRPRVARIGSRVGNFAIVKRGLVLSLFPPLRLLGPGRYSLVSSVTGRRSLSVNK